MQGAGSMENWADLPSPRRGQSGSFGGSKWLNAPPLFPWDKGPDTRAPFPHLHARWVGRPSPSPAGADPRPAPPLNHPARAAPGKMGD